MMKLHPFVVELYRQRVLPVLRSPCPGEAFDAALAVVDAGLEVVELTATTPQWPEVLSRVRGERPGAIIGVGTVTTVETADAAFDAGASFIVSPWPVPAVREVAYESGTPLVEGAFTPAEVAAGARRAAVKVFPAHVGGPAYLRSLRAGAARRHPDPGGGHQARTRLVVDRGGRTRRQHLRGSSRG